MSEESIDWRSGGLGLRWLGAVALSVALLGAVLWLGDPAEVWATVSTARLEPLASATGCYAVVVLVRWVRLAALDPRGELRTELLGVSAGHSLANQLLPARSGELAFPALWRWATEEGVARGTVYLAAIRAVELGVVAPIFGVALVVWWSRVAFGLGVAGAAGLSVVGGGLLLAGFPFLIRAALGAVDWLSSRRPLRGIAWLDSVREEVPRARAALAGLGARERLWLVVTSLVMWAAMFGVYYSALVACGAGIGVVQTIVGSAGGIVGNLLPIGAIGSLGTMEAGWTAAFRATGAATGPVVAAGLVVHAIVICGAAVATAAAGVSYHYAQQAS
jgi:uncharacterized membrane protein YbhN (UPF0104 family)